MENLRTYKELIAWQKSMALVNYVYGVTKSFPTEEKFGLISHINRSAVSVPANIAEGWGRFSTKNFIQFLRISRGSLYELETLLIISQNQGYISNENFENVDSQIDENSKILNALIKSLEFKLAKEVQ